MPLSLYAASVPVYARRLEALSAILVKAEADATARKIDQATLLQSRLYPDMLALSRQVPIACGHALRGSARLSGGEPVSVDIAATSFEELRAGIAKTIEVIRGYDPAKFAAMEDKEITFPVGERKETLSSSDYLLHFSMPNFYFHVTVAYAILRHNGLEIGKDDFMGAK